jgi:hypothetical protein
VESKLAVLEFLINACLSLTSLANECTHRAENPLPITTIEEQGDSTQLSPIDCSQECFSLTDLCVLHFDNFLPEFSLQNLPCLIFFFYIFS